MIMDYGVSRYKAEPKSSEFLKVTTKDILAIKEIGPLVQGLEASPWRKAKKPQGFNFTLSSLAWKPCGITLSDASISFTQSIATPRKEFYT